MASSPRFPSLSALLLDVERAKAAIAEHGCLCIWMRWHDRSGPRPPPCAVGRWLLFAWRQAIRVLAAVEVFDGACNPSPVQENQRKRRARRQPSAPYRAKPSREATRDGF